jgi:hypothetical protein
VNGTPGLVASKAAPADLAQLGDLGDRARAYVSAAKAADTLQAYRDVGVSRDDLVVAIRRSKTDQNGAGRPVGVPYGSNRLTCPVRALEMWLAAAAIAEGPLFRGVDRHGRLLPGRCATRTRRRSGPAETGALPTETLLTGHGRSGSLVLQPGPAPTLPVPPGNR